MLKSTSVSGAQFFTMSRFGRAIGIATPSTGSRRWRGRSMRRFRRTRRKFDLTVDGKKLNCPPSCRTPFKNMVGSAVGVATVPGPGDAEPARRGNKETEDQLANKSRGEGRSCRSRRPAVARRRGPERPSAARGGHASPGPPAVGRGHGREDCRLLRQHEDGRVGEAGQYGRLSFIQASGRKTLAKAWDQIGVGPRQGSKGARRRPARLRIERDPRGARTPTCPCVV